MTAKGHLGLWEAIIEKYTQPGDTILDPMAGVGATLTAALMGRNVMCNEMEHHFLLPMVRSWAKMMQHPFLGAIIGEVEILWGDARDFGTVQPWPYRDLAIAYPKDSWTTLRARRRKYHLPLVSRHLPLNSADAAIFSPPYEGIAVTAGDQARSPSILFPQGERTDRGRIKRDGLFERGYTRPVDAIVSSPPYEGFTEPNDEQRQAANKSYKFTKRRGYTRPVDAIVSSPPFQDNVMSGRQETPHGGSNYAGLSPNPPYNHQGAAYTTRSSATGRFMDSTTESRRIRGLEAGTNIGNLRTDAYWGAMRQVYAECHRVLRPGGIMALVLKGFTRNGQYVDLPAQTAEMVESLGFVHFDTWRRELWSLSFWRILQRRRSPDTFDDRLNYESVLAFRKDA